MKILFSLSTAIGICAIATSVNAGNVADVDIVTFTANTAAKASEVNANFTKLKVENNDNDARITTNATSITTINNTLAGATFFYGDGSAGSLTISANTSWVPSGSAPATGLNFTNVTIDVGQTLTVPRGTTIRCTGDFVNNGTIIVDSNTAGFSFGGYFSISNNSIRQSWSMPAHPGDANRIPGFPSAIGDGAAVSLDGGYTTGAEISKTIAMSSFHQFRHGGSGGGGAYSTTGGTGGGLLKVYCRGTVTNAGTITANGGTGSGGGAGGIVILASTTQVVNDTGTINAAGGNGNPSNTIKGADGGGGGGIIVLAAPVVTNTGTTNVAAGTAGTLGAASSVTNAFRSGGGAGGSCGGVGGNGGSVGTTGTPNIPGTAEAGYVIQLTTNPATMIP